MSDPRPVDQERLWRVLRAAEPPDGAAERVRERVERSLGRRPRRRVAIAVSVAVAAAVALLVVVRGGEVEIRPAAPRALSAASARQDGREIVAGQTLGTSAAVQVAGAGNLRIALDRAEVDVAGPAAVELRPRGLFVREGRVEIRGATRVAGPGCEAEVSGRAAVEVQRGHVQVTVFAGSASVAQSQVTCTVIDLTRPGAGTESGQPTPATGAGAGPTQSAQPADAPATAGTASPPEVPASPSADTALAGQVDAYWAAERLRASDPAAALARFEALQARWPRSPLRPEIDLAIIDLLVQLDRTEAARARAREFLRRYPDSPRRDDVRRIEMRQ